MLEITRRVAAVGVYFLILLTAGSAFNYIFTKVLEEEGETNLAPLNFIIVFCFSLVSNLVAPLTKFPEKWMMVLTSLAYGLDYSFGYFLFGDDQTLKYILLCSGAALGGWSTSYFWLGMGRYIHKTCHLYKKEGEKGHYYGTFNSIYSLNNITGGIVVTFGLQLFSHQSYFLLITGIAVLAFPFGAVAIKNIRCE